MVKILNSLFKEFLLDIKQMDHEDSETLGPYSRSTKIL